MSSKLTPGQIEEEFDLAYEEFIKDRQIERKQWDMYSGFDYGQWPKEAVNELMNSRGHVIQLNYIRGKVDTLAGTIVKNGLEIDFVPVDDEAIDATKILKGLFYSDREMFNWDTEYLAAVKDGLVHRGILEMYISEKYSALGNVGLKRCEPGHIILDPNWVSGDSSELKRLWKVSYLTPKEMKEIYNKSSEMIDAAVARQAERISSYDKDLSANSMTYFELDSVYGDLYRVIEYHHIETKKTKTSLAIIDGDVIDITVFSDEELSDLKEKFGEDKVKIIEKEHVEKEYWVTTTCKQLMEGFLEDAKSEIQIGRLPFYPWSAARINGKDSGVVSLLVDAQQAINKRESLSDHIISTSAHGSMFVDSALFNGDVGKTEQAIKKLSQPDARIVTPPGTIASGRNMFYQVPKAQYQGEIYQEIDRMRGHLDVLSKATATLEGRSESSHDTGVLFARRQMQSEIALATLSNGLEQLWNDIGEGYLFLAQDLYSGPFRRFATNFGDPTEDRAVIELNSDQYSLKQLPRTKVIVSQSPRGVTLREVERELNSELLQRIPPEQQLYRATVTRNIINTLDMTGEEKKALDIANEIEYKLAVKRSQLELANINFQLMQMQQQEQQMQMQQQQAMMQAQMGGPPPQQGAEEQPPQEGQPPQQEQAPQQEQQMAQPQQ